MKSNTFSAPEWAKRAVWYQIFPERFRNGDPKNDPTINDIEGAYPHDTSSPWQIHPWTADWYELQPYERKNGKDIWFNLQRRRYGGDVQGILDKLDYLQKLGINAIYLTPVFESPSLHKYDATTYHHIDPNFGPDPEWDRKIIASETGHDPTTWKWTSADRLMLHLINEVHRRGMRIIFDGVFNHIGLNHWAFRDVAQRQQASRYRDWFKILSWQNAKTGESFQYQGWWSLKELPEWRQDENGIVTGPRDYIFAITKRWMDPNNDGDPGDGIDGWRLDVAACVHHQFWKRWREHVKSINPEAYLTGELIDPIAELQPYLQGDEFDAVMNYNFTFACSEYFMNERTRIPAGEFDRRLRELREAFPRDVAYVMQNLLDSHDTDRFVSRIINRDKRTMRDWMDYYKWSCGNGADYDGRKPNAAERQVQKLLALFQMTYLGAPMIYYGTEAGMWGANDPSCRKPMVWEDLDHAEASYLSNGEQRAHPETVAFDHDIFEHYRKLIRVRNTHPALQVGNYHTLLADDARDLLAFSRSHENENMVVVVNNSSADQRAIVPALQNSVYDDLLEDNHRFASNGEQLEVDLKAKSGRILIRRA